MRSRFASRVDSNHQQIKRALEACGYKVWSLHRQGYGVPDLLVLTRRNIPVLLEVKRPGEKLTKPEEKFHADYKGLLIIVESEQAAVDAMAFYDEFRVELYDPN